MEYVIAIAALVGMAILVFGCFRQQRARFAERFPPISDEEFVALCKPGTNPVVALWVRKILAEALNVEYDHIHPSSRLIEDLGAE